jgi:hypothetical protein
VASGEEVLCEVAGRVMVALDEKFM